MSSYLGFLNYKQPLPPLMQEHNINDVVTEFRLLGWPVISEARKRLARIQLEDLDFFVPEEIPATHATVLPGWGYDKHTQSLRNGTLPIVKIRKLLCDAPRGVR